MGNVQWHEANNKFIDVHFVAIAYVTVNDCYICGHKVRSVITSSKGMIY